MELRELADNLVLYQLLKGQSVERAIEPVPATCSHPTARTSARPMDLPWGDPHRDTPMSSRPQPEPGFTRAEVESIVRQGIESTTESKNELTSADADRIARGVTHAGAAPTTETIREGESRP